jgi:hypothetical protein
MKPMQRFIETGEVERFEIHKDLRFYAKRIRITYGAVKTQLHFAQELPYEGEFKDTVDTIGYFDNPRGMLSLANHCEEWEDEWIREDGGGRRLEHRLIEGWSPIYLFFSPQWGWVYITPLFLREAHCAENWMFSTPADIQSHQFPRFCRGALFLLRAGEERPKKRWCSEQSLLGWRIAFGEGWDLFAFDGEREHIEDLRQRGIAVFAW